MFEEILEDARNRVVSDEVYAEYERKEKEERLKEFHKKCGMDSQYYDASINSSLFNDEQRKVLAEYVDKIKGLLDYPPKTNGEFLIILGNVGTGKTYSACAIMNELQTGIYYDMPELRLKLNTADRFNAQQNREQFLHKLATIDLLILDEVGRFAGKQDEEREVLFYLLNKRYANKRPTIICTNLDAQEFSAFIGQALIDRLKGRNTKLIFNGSSLRGEICK